MSAKTITKKEAIELAAYLVTLFGLVGVLSAPKKELSTLASAVVLAAPFIGFILFYINHGLKGASVRFVGFQVAFILAVVVMIFIEVGFTNLNEAVENISGSISYVHAMHFFLMCLLCFYLLKKYG